MTFEWWHWAVLGLGLVLAELAVPAFVLVWFGLGALILALLTAVFTDIGATLQLSLWIAASLSMVFLWFKVFRSSSHKTRIGTSDAEVIGEIGLMVRDVAPFGRGTVRFQKPVLGADTWECIADEAIASGDRVKVLNVEGSLLRVGRA